MKTFYNTAETLTALDIILKQSKNKRLKRNAQTLLDNVWAGNFFYFKDFAEKVEILFAKFEHDLEKRGEYHDKEQFK